MGQTSELKEFSGCRARLQRLRDAKLFTGWIVSATSTAIEVKWNVPVEVSIGDMFFVQAVREDWCATFTGLTTSTSNQSSTLIVEKAPTLAQSNEEARIFVDRLRCAVKLGWYEAVVNVLDVSANGLGLQLNVNVQKGETIELSIVSSLGEIVLRGQVRYCRRIDGTPSDHRVGVAIQGMDRVTSAKWERLLEDATKTANAA